MVRFLSSVIDPSLWFFATRRKIRRHRLRATAAVRVTHDLRLLLLTGPSPRLTRHSPQTWNRGFAHDRLAASEKPAPVRQPSLCPLLRVRRARHGLKEAVQLPNQFFHVRCVDQTEPLCTQDPLGLRAVHRVELRERLRRDIHAELPILGGLHGRVQQAPPVVLRRSVHDAVSVTAGEHSVADCSLMDSTVNGPYAQLVCAFKDLLNGPSR